MKKAKKQQLIRAGGLTMVTVTGLGLAQNVAQAKDSAVRVETIEIDFQEKTEQPTPAISSDAQASTLGIQNQFIFLFALTVLGMVGIFGILKDFRRRH